MQHWTKVKDDKNTGTLQDMIDQMLKKKRATKKDGFDYQLMEDKKEELKKKMEEKKIRKQKKEEQLISDSKDSYMSKEQFEFLQNNIDLAGKRLREQQNYIDIMETKMIKHLEVRRAKERRVAVDQRESFLLQ